MTVPHYYDERGSDDEHHGCAFPYRNCVDCLERALNRGEEVPLDVPDHIMRGTSAPDEDDYRIGEGSFFEHFERVERIEPSEKYV